MAPLVDRNVASMVESMDPLAQDIYKVVVSKKGNACPIMCRLAWHASGTYDAKAGKGGSNGATMRFPEEAGDGANAGLSLARDMLQSVKSKHPDVSYADLWTYAGALIIQFAGGPKIPFKFGREDASNGAACPVNGLLPDAAQGAEHLRDVFYRMGFNDRDIVALIGAHTLGRCNKSRSGYEGPWTKDPYKFDNAYFKNLLYLNWRRRNWDGPLQYEDAESGELMMTPGDMAIREDSKFREYAELYATDEEAFFKDFSYAYSKLLHLGHPSEKKGEIVKSMATSEKFRAEGGAGRLGMLAKLWKDGVNVHEPDPSTGRTVLHKASLSGHDHTIDFLLEQCKINPNVQDFDGDTALHDACRYGQLKVISKLLSGGADPRVKNHQGHDALDAARTFGKHEAMTLLQQWRGRGEAPNYAWQSQQNPFSAGNYGHPNYGPQYSQNYGQQPPLSPPPYSQKTYGQDPVSRPMSEVSTTYSNSPRRLRQGAIAGQRVLITYATSAIGRACAFQFAEHGCQLLLMAVVQEEKELLSLAREIKHQSEAYGKSIPSMELIVFSPRDTDMLTDLPNRVGAIDILVNNVEITDCFSPRSKTDPMSMIASNLVSPLALVGAFGPVMKQRGSGHIVSLCSAEVTADFGTGFCTSTQATLKAYMESIQKEFINTPVRLTTVNIHSREDNYPEPVPADPQDISDQILFAVTRPRHVQIFSMNSGSRRSEGKYWPGNGWMQGEQNWQNQLPPYQQNGGQNNMPKEPVPVFSFDPAKPGMNPMSQGMNPMNQGNGKSQYMVQNFAGPGPQNFACPGQQNKISQKEVPHPFAMETTPPPSPRLAGMTPPNPRNPVSLM